MYVSDFYFLLEYARTGKTYRVLIFFSFPFLKNEISFFIPIVSKILFFLHYWSGNWIDDRFTKYTYLLIYLLTYIK